MANDIVRTDANTPAYLADGGGRTGLEGISNECIAIPFLKLAQDLTPEARKVHSQYLEGLSPGMFFNRTTRSIYGSKLKVVVLGFYQQFGEWEGDPPNAKPKGFYSQMEYERDIMPECKEVKTMKNGKEIT